MIQPKIEELQQLIKDEFVQKEQEGFDTSAVEAKYKNINQWSIEDLENLFVDLEQCPTRPDFLYDEPANWVNVKASWSEQPPKTPLTLSEAELYDKIYGGWLGRCAGCILGKPVEFLSKAQIKYWLEMTDAYPLTNYVPPLPNLPKDAPDWLVTRVSLIENWSKARRSFEDWKPNTMLGRITHMVRDDDIDYTIMRLDVADDFGLNFTTSDVGELLIYQVPYRRIWSAERAVYRNLVNGILPPESATYLNPYREQVGATSRGDMWAYLNPGNPALAAEVAYRDASLSHVKNGVYGGMFSSAMISAAFVTNNIREIVETGLSVIPKNSRLAEALNNVVAWSKKYRNWEDTWEQIIQNYGYLDRAHTINNVALILLGVIYGQGDFEKSIAITVMSGVDADSTAATVGSLLGVMTGTKALPPKWVEPLNDRVESYVVGYHDSRISDLAKQTLKHTQAVLESN